MKITLKDNQGFSCGFTATDAAENPAPVQDPKWTVGDPTLLNVTVSDDGLSCDVKATGKLGTTQLILTADADMGDGVKPITGIADIDIIAGEAVNIVLTPGTPVDNT